MTESHFFFFLLILLCNILSFSTSDDVFVSIDCGASNSYTDDNLINWLGDEAYIDTGEVAAVKSNSSVSRPLDTLRVFDTRKKNCYHIDSIRPGRVLVRASFNYGNYDGKSSPPTFDLLLDGNRWGTVETSSSDYVYYEVIYVMKKDSIVVCVAQTTEGHLPFISALEVRGLEANMYSYIDDIYPLFLMRRAAYGAKSTIRFTSDPYDRIWTPFSAGEGLTTVSSNISFTGISGIADNPPPAVLQNAITATNRSTTIRLFLPLPSAQIPVYINFYFSEVSRLSPNDTRSFRIFKDNISFSQPIVPIYENFTKLYVSNLLVSSNTTFYLVPSNDSTLAPLINGLELFLVGPELSSGTNTRDVGGLASLQKAFAILQGWRGDPCLPAPYSWDWINCSSGSTPRVKALFLDRFGLSGELPDLSSMDALETIDLQNNNINGPIPDSLGNLANLKELPPAPKTPAWLAGSHVSARCSVRNLANNNLSGTVPTSLSQKKGLNLNVTGNPNLCSSRDASCLSSDSSKKPKSSGTKNENKISTEVLLAVTIASLVIMGMAI
ncbi:probable LRR receptor-like serine/threonine-protein kinase At1g05700 [Andrographis paniculata]|uniref:probable LRR receptor-like serine/threonine-protein kinase At1g05700 n=1 Tax=Andrographis paniculata TaxID=175694 RepID=UPI0021E72EA1|nr:probable LRR receptor-like serine/threonine-protein kinase At1g05700 [Andrographis paniculata]